MNLALLTEPATQHSSLLVCCLAFGFLVGITAMAFALAAGGGMIAAISAYVAAGSLGLLGMAALSL